MEIKISYEEYKDLLEDHYYLGAILDTVAFAPHEIDAIEKKYEEILFDEIVDFMLEEALK